MYYWTEVNVGIVNNHLSSTVAWMAFRRLYIIHQEPFCRVEVSIRIRHNNKLASAWEGESLPFIFVVDVREAYPFYTDYVSNKPIRYQGVTYLD